MSACCGGSKKKKKPENDDDEADDKSPPACYFDNDGIIRFFKKNETPEYVTEEEELGVVLLAEKDMCAEPEPYEYDEGGYPIVPVVSATQREAHMPRRSQSPMSGGLSPRSSPRRSPNRSPDRSPRRPAPRSPSPQHNEDHNYEVVRDDASVSSGGSWVSADTYSTMTTLMTHITDPVVEARRLRQSEMSVISETVQDPDPSVMTPLAIKSTSAESKEGDGLTLGGKSSAQETVKTKEEFAQELGDPWFIVEAAWVTSWLAYVHVEAGISPRPGPIYNMGLLHFDEDGKFVARKNLRADSGNHRGHFRAVKPAVWKAYVDFYPESGPFIFCRGDFTQTDNWYVDVGYFRRSEDALRQCSLAHKWIAMLKGKYVEEEEDEEDEDDEAKDEEKKENGKKEKGDKGGAAAAIDRSSLESVPEVEEPPSPTENGEAEEKKGEEDALLQVRPDVNNNYL
uniref:DUSP domain-containing protein n=1 Tax=Phaeomonas parva TaxID=124430 RepID=A0A7S1UJU2_9STRA